MKLPNVPSEADEILPWAVDMTAAVRAIWPQRGGDIIPSIRLNGTTWRLARSQSGAVSSPALRSFGAVGISVPDSEGGSPTIYLLVAEGTLNGMGDGFGLAVTGKVTGPGAPASGWKFALSPSSEKYGIAKVTFDTDGATTAADFYLSDDVPDDDEGDPETGEPPEHVYRALFKVSVDGDYIITVTQYTDGSQQAVPVVRDWSCATITKGILWLP